MELYINRDNDRNRGKKSEQNGNSKGNKEKKVTKPSSETNKIDVETITHEKLKITGTPYLKTLLDLEITSIPNEHTKLVLRGYGEYDEAIKIMEGAFFGNPIEVCPVLTDGNNDSRAIFSGIITECRRINGNEINEINEIEVIAHSATLLLDDKLKSRSFQNVSMTYKEVVNIVLKDTKNASGLFSVGMDTPIGKPLIQYLETDWEFIKRLASHFNAPIIADVTNGNPNIFFGLNREGDERFFDNTYSNIGVSQKYYEEDGKSFGLTPNAFMYYKIKSKGNYTVGDRADINGIKLKICEKYVNLIKSELEFTYLLGYPSLVSVKTSYNKKIIGMSLLGTVTKTNGETVNIQLDIDGSNGKSEYPYDWIPPTGNIMYCMPKLGTKVSLLLADHDERNAKATNSPRGNGVRTKGAQSDISEKCDDMKDYNNRAFTTEHNKKLLLYPGSMGAVGCGSEETPLHMTLTDEENIHLQSHKDILIVAQEEIELIAPETTFNSPLKIDVVRTDTANTYQEVIVPVGTGITKTADEDEEEPQAVSVNDDTYLILNNQFDIEGRHGVFAGWEYEVYEPYDDAPEDVTPEEEPFSLWNSLGKAAAVIGAAVAAVGVLVLGTGGLGAVVVSAAIGAVISTGFVLADDIVNKTNSSWNEYCKSGIVGAIAGATKNPYASTVVDIVWSIADGSFSLERAAKEFIIGSVISKVSGKCGSFLTSVGKKFIKKPPKIKTKKTSDIPKKDNAGCRREGEPVDAVGGFVFYNLTDFSYPGVIPLEWERSWYSVNAKTLGIFGYGSSSLFSTYIQVEEENIIFTDEHGRKISFEKIQLDKRRINRAEKLILSIHEGSYEIFNYDERLYFTFFKIAETNKYILKKISNETKEHCIKIQHDKNNNLSLITDTTGRNFNITTNETGQVTKIDVNGITVAKYEYDEKLNLISITNSNDYKSSIFYEEHLMVKRVTRNGDTETFKRGIIGELLEAKNQNSVLTFEYDNIGNLIKETQNGYSVESSYYKEHIGILTGLKTSLGLNMNTSLNKFGQTEEVNAGFGDNAVYKSNLTYNIVGQMLERNITTSTQKSVKDSWSYDMQGRPVTHGVRINERESSRRQYKWETGGKLKSIIDSISNMGLEYSYDKFGIPEVENCKGVKLPPDKYTTIRHIGDSGNVYNTRSKIERKYKNGGQLETAKHKKYTYDECGDLIQRIDADGKVWRYFYSVGGLMERVVRPDKKEVTFKYDALGRRISKDFNGKSTKYLWNGNTVIHEWVEDQPTNITNSEGKEENKQINPPQNVFTWLYDDGTFTPLAKLTDTGAYSIISVHLGTPSEMVDQNGKIV